MINEENYITLLGIVRNRLQFDDLEEFIIYSIIYGYTQGRHGWYDGNTAYLAEWISASFDTAKRRLQRLTDKGYITATQRAGKSTIYQAVELSKIAPSANCVPSAQPCVPYPPQNAHRPSAQPCVPPSNNNINNNINNPPPPNAHARGIKKLKEWVDSSNLTEYAQRKLYEYNSDLTTDNLLAAFYEDVLVQEDVENNQRRDVISHYQKWIPKYLKSINDERTNQRQSSSRATDPFADLERIAATMRPDGSRSE